MTNTRTLYRIAVPVEDLPESLADDGYPPLWLSTFVKEKLRKWQVADSVSFGVVARKGSSSWSKKNLLIEFTLGLRFEQDTEYTMDLAADCIVQALLIYGTTLSCEARQREYYQDIERQRALDDIVQGGTKLWNYKSVTTVLSEEIRLWLARVGAMRAGSLHLVRN